MKTHRDAIAAILGLVLGVSAMTGVVATDLYAQAAGAQARGDQALFQAIAPLRHDASIAPALLAENEAAR